MDLVKAQASSFIPRCSYDVFLSFRGEDTRKNFTDHLYTALVRAGFHTFRDDDEIERGENIEAELQKAIEQSRISVIVFSKTYAASTWCLDELVKILHRKDAYRQQVLPIFYDVDPSDVRKQRGSFAEAFTIHEKQLGAETREGMKKVEHWREALRDVADLAGMVLQNQSNGYEAKFIQKIVKVIGDKLDRRVLSIPSVLIGIHERVKNINLWLQDGAIDVSVVAICGMGGIGKTTMAKFVYNLNRGNFDASCFLANIRERSHEPNGLVKLQKQMLSDIGKEEKVSCVDEGIIKIGDAICCKRLLLVLDDVDHVDQLSAMFGMRHMFCPGSKVIVTTRHEWLLNHREVVKVHKVDPLNYEESLELFCWHAFGQSNPIEYYLNLSIRVVQHCGGLPLALQVLGSSLSGKVLDVWESALEKLEAIPHSQILEKLKISYDSLQDDHDKDLFLHIACFFTGWDRDMTITILDKCDFFTTIGIQNLLDRCLLTIDWPNKLRMHKLIQDMGREIVRQESPKEPGGRSRLWQHKDSFHVLREKTGTCVIEGLILDMHIFKEDKPTKARISVDDAIEGNHEGTLNKFFPNVRNSLKRRVSRFSKHSVNSSMLTFVESDAFSKMQKLQLLQLNYVQIKGHLNCLPNRVRWLCWHGFPLRTIPSDFLMESVVALDMRYSNLKKVWKGTKILKLLKILDLSHSYELIKSPNLSGAPNLEKLILEDCVNLIEIHESTGNIEGLSLLNLNNCRNLKKVPSSICMLKYLDTLIISGCSNLDWFPKHQNTLSSSRMRHDDVTDLKGPASEEFKSWHSIILSSVSKTQRYPHVSDIIYLPHSLVNLSLSGCNLFDDDFPLDFSNLCLLKCLDLGSNQICSLPESVKDLTMLHTLILDSCKRLTSLTGISNVRLENLSVRGCTSLEKISYKSTLCGPLGMRCIHCDNLVEVEGHFKLEPVNGVDIMSLTTWGFSIREPAVNYCSPFTSEWIKKLSLQKLYEGGVYSYFFPGDRVASGFNIKREGSTLSFVVPISVDHYKIRGLVLCSVYTTTKCNMRRSELLGVLSTTMENRTKHYTCYHYPVIFGMPKVNEYMIWLSNWNFKDLLDVGDEVEISVGDTFAKPRRNTFDVKEVGILFLYQSVQEEEMGAQLNEKTTFLDKHDFSEENSLRIFGAQSVVKNQFSYGLLPKACLRP